MRTPAASITGKTLFCRVPITAFTAITVFAFAAAITLALIAADTGTALACTNLIVTKGATVDGSHQKMTCPIISQSTIGMNDPRSCLLDGIPRKRLNWLTSPCPGTWRRALSRP